MRYFLDTVDTVPEGVGFSHFDMLHLGWLALFAITVVVCCIWYRKMGTKGRKLWKKTVALLIVLDEVFKMAMLFVGNRYTLGYLPLHLCSINIFIITFHAWKPTKTVGSFLYTVCIPGALAALLFPSWADLPIVNFMHIHSFTVHILLALYPIVLTASGEIEVKIKAVPKCLLLLLGMAIPIYIFNMIFDTNFMFLMRADEGNPLKFFEQLWGNHLLGFPVIITAIILVLYVPVELYRIVNKRKEQLPV